MSKATYKISKIDRQTYCKTNGHFARHLKSFGLTYKEYFETYEAGVTPLCYFCKPLTFYQKTESYANSCGDPGCVGKSISLTKQQWSDAKKKEDSENKKVAAAQRTAEQKQQQLQKARKTFKEKYGVEWGSELDSQKEKSRKTKLEKYGDESYNNSSAISKTNMSKSHEEKNQINKRRRQTNKEKYGVENVLLLPKNASKINKGNASIKDYVLPSGKVVGVRGHEPLALNLLFKYFGYNESQVIVHDDYTDYGIRVFEYEAVNRHIKKYYPDIYIPCETRIIEVKSEWWWDGYGKEKYKSRLINNLRKRTAVVDAGYNYEVWLFSSKKQYRILKSDSDFQTEFKKLQSINA